MCIRGGECAIAWQNPSPYLPVGLDQHDSPQDPPSEAAPRHRPAPASRRPPPAGNPFAALGIQHTTPRRRHASRRPSAADVSAPVGVPTPAGVPAPAGVRAPVGVPAPAGVQNSVGCSSPVGAQDPVGCSSRSRRSAPVGVPDTGGVPGRVVRIWIALTCVNRVGYPLECWVLASYADGEPTTHGDIPWKPKRWTWRPHEPV